jgi:catechol 2,3-dioxygenase-like lactoylglutathione lyase family enzyme
VRISTVNLQATDAAALARFYAELLGFEVAVEEPGWVLLRDPAGGTALSCQTEDGYVRPSWPHGPGDQLMQMHLEVQVDDLDAAEATALAAGSVRHEHQPQDDVRVMLDPDGHPFCLWIET